MHWIDWSIVALFCVISLALGTIFSRRAGQNLEAYFLSNRQLGWWLAGTSLAATAFSSDTPLLITGMVRRRGIWGTWEVLALAASTMLGVFVFARLWKRTGVMTEVELVERRYSGRAAAFLRGFKAIYWGLLYNCFVMAAWPVMGMTKVLQETTGFSREAAIICSVVVGTCYTSLSGLWGVIVTDAFQFIWAMAGAVILAWWAVAAAGGLGEIASRLSAGSTLAAIPPLPGPEVPFWSSPFGWFLGLMLVQWWAWKNTDGGGIAVQRLLAVRDERQAVGSVLWFSIAHYCLRAWPWILTALASLVLIPDASLQVQQAGAAFIDHERAYPRLITQLLPVGLRGVLVASFFAAFLSTISTHLNWGASYLVNDGYRRFVRRHADERHYLRVSRAIPFGLALAAGLIAMRLRSIGEAFTLVLNLTAGIGPVYLLRWLWWRVNPWSEIAAMVASVPLLECRARVLAALGLPSGSLIELLYMVVATGLVWVPVTLLTPPVDRRTLARFYETVRPPGLWRPIAGVSAARERWAGRLAAWACSTLAIIATAMGPLQWMLRRPEGVAWCVVAVVAWIATALALRLGAVPAAGDQAREAPSGLSGEVRGSILPEQSIVDSP
ncbi:MAG: Na+:solute symporter [Candidatus Omnitrophica bacterium]|nr:Na+:solute symporter [Candidatus Omnitrophota bacterium]